MAPTPAAIRNAKVAATAHTSNLWINERCCHHLIMLGRTSGVASWSSCDPRFSLKHKYGRRGHYDLR
jgi:hypothetical protein